jgi:hypothetical protein
VAHLRPRPRSGLLACATLAFSSLLGVSSAWARPPVAPGAAPEDPPVERAAEPATAPAAEASLSPSTDPSAAPATPAPAVEAEVRATPFQPKPPPLHVNYLQYGVALAANARLASGATCPDDAETETPCILGGGGGLVVRVGSRPPGAWYFGGAYEFASMDSGNLYRLGILQQLRGEFRYLPETGFRVAPYLSAGLGGFGYGNEWGVETGGAVAFIGGGIEYEVTRFALVGIGLAYTPMVIAGWTDTANQDRETSLAQFLRLELVFELRSEVSREDPETRVTASGPRGPSP